jgi:uncharacterized membrane protein
MRRLVVAAAVGAVALLLLWLLMTWQIAVLGGWDAAALTFLASVMPIMLRADGPQTEHLALKEDETRDTARLLLLLACGASLIAVAFALGLATHEHGLQRGLLVTVATLTVVVSWTVVNCVFTLRYAHIYYTPPPDGIDFGLLAPNQPDYRDFGYLAFTIGMTYQVSDTALRDRRIRRVVLLHSFVSYLFGVVIVATGVNVVAGLLD